MLVVVDIEADSLNPTQIWVIVVKEIDSGLVHTFRHPTGIPSSASEFADLVQNVSGWIAHNGIHFDIPVINRLIPSVYIDPTKVIDTLVVSKLVDFTVPGGHSLEAWGERLGHPKGSFPSEWFSTFLDHWDEGVKYCKQDVEVTHQLYEKFKPYIHSPRWKKAMRIEHDTEIMCTELHENGFSYNIEASRELLGRIEGEVNGINQELQELFPPRFKAVRSVVPVLTKSGTLNSKDFRWCPDEERQYYSAGSPFTIVEPVSFDPASKMQVIDRLWDAKWKPTSKTDGYKKLLKDLRRGRGRKPSVEEQEKVKRYERYGWKLDDTNLATIPEDGPVGARKLSRWLHLTGRANQVRGWQNEYNQDTGKIHGKFWGIGAWSQRMSHSNPNMANASAEHEYRSLWTADPNTVLVGCDAEGIQLRILAHYINDPVFTKALISGDKKTGTDAHSLNAKALGEVCLRHGDKARDRAKTFIYAFVLGASPPKVAEIFECRTGEAEDAIDRFVAAYPGLAILKREIIPRDAKRGYFEGFDGRCVKQTSEHLMLAGYLQAGEACIMKHARKLWNDRLKSNGTWFRQVNFVHDEWQTVALRADADTVGRTQSQAIVDTGITLGVRCPQAGEYKIGLNWAETH